MPKKNIWWRILLALVSAGALLQFSLGPAAAQVPANVALPGNIAPAVAAGRLTAVGRADESQTVTLVIGLKLPDPAGVQAAVAAVRGRLSAPLSPQQFVDRYAPTAGDYGAVVSWLTGTGFQVQTSPNRLIVTATGSLGLAARVFGVTVDDYSLDGRPYFADATAPLVPASLAGTIESVAGLDNLPTFNTFALPASQGSQAVAGTVYYNSDGFTPQGLKAAYDVPPVYTAVNGTGQAVDIVVWNGIQQSDIYSFDSAYGLPATVINQIPVGLGWVPPDFVTPDSGSVEATEDVEMVHALAPGAGINVYEAPSGSGAYLEEAVNEAVVQHAADVLTMGWGADEDDLFVTGCAKTMDAIFAQGAAEGMTLLAASGDYGNWAPHVVLPTNSFVQYGVSFPACDPYVTGVGGTALAPAADGAYGGETAWNSMQGLGQGPGSSVPGYSSGGGFSAQFGAPAWQQATVDGYTYRGTPYNSHNWRGVPDLALNAGTPTAVFYNGAPGSALGTGLAVSCWAGLAALVNQAYASAGKGSLGCLNPLIYNLGRSNDYQSVFHQVYIGDNDPSTSGDAPYYAAYGWNPVTGWGTPDFQKLFDYLINPPAVTPSIMATPNSNYTVITITGTNTNFDSSTQVALEFNGQDESSLISNVQVQNAASLTFDLPSFNQGTGTITVSDPVDGSMTAVLTVDKETAAISPDTLQEGYPETLINITGYNSQFASINYEPTEPYTTVEVVYADTQEPALDLGLAGVPYLPAVVMNNTAAYFFLPPGLATGLYDVVVNDNASGVSLSIPLTVQAVGAAITRVAVNPTASIAGTAQPVDVDVTTSGATDGTRVTAYLLDSYGRPKADISGTISGNTADLVLTVPANLGAGSYSVQVVIPGAAGSPYDAGSYTVTSNVPAYTVQAVAASSAPVAGADDTVTLTVTNSNGHTDLTFTGPHNVTVSGYDAAPDGGYGSLDGTVLTASPPTVDLDFNYGTATTPLHLALDDAAAQNIEFAVAGVQTPDTLPITPGPGAEAKMALTRDIAAPAANGGLFAVQPAVALEDTFGNIRSGDNTTTVTAARIDSGSWTLTGTPTQTAFGGVATWTDLGAANTAALTGARLAFSSGTLPQIKSSAVDLPGPAPQTSGGGGGGAPAPAVTAITPANGPPAGGTTVTITGTRFTGATAVNFGSVAATSFQVYSDTTLKAVSPAGTGTVAITVTGSGSTTSPTSAGDRFTYTNGVPIGPSGGTATSSDDSAILVVPADAFEDITYVAITPPASAPPAAPTGFTTLGAWSIDTGGVEPGQPVTLTLKFDPGDLQGLDPARAGIYLYDQSSGTWTWVGGTVDLIHGTITVQLSHLSTYALFVNTSRFYDLDQAPWAKPAVDTLLGADVIQGVAPGVFDPMGGLTRAQLATLVVKAAGLTPVPSGSTPFTDVAPTAWYTPYVAAAYDAQLVEGTGAALFDPNAAVTREQAAVIMMRAMEAMHLTGLALPARSPAFADEYSVSTWARTAVNQVAAYRLMRGYPDGTFQPRHTVTRAQGAVVLANFLGYVQMARSGALPE